MNDIERILLQHIPDLRENGEELIGRCPFHDDVNPSFGLNTSTGLWHCFGCGAGGSLLNLLERLTKDFLKSSLLVANLEFKEPIQVIADTELPSNDGSSDYLMRRGYNSKVLYKYNIYYNVHRGLIIPVYDEKSNLVGWIERRHSYKYSRGLPRRSVVYNLNNNLLNNPIYVVEGALDAIWLEQWGYPAIATLGATVSLQQIELINRWFKDIITIPDNDTAGHNMGAKLAKLLDARVIIPPIDNTDIQDYSGSQVKAMLG